MNFSKSFEHDKKLYLAAIKEFSLAGYQQASINTILDQAGMSKGQFYYHFKNKQDLYFALIESMIEKKQVFLSTQITPQDLDQDFFSILKKQIQLGIGFAAAHPDIHAFSESFLREIGKPIYKQVLKRFNFDNHAGLNHLIETAYSKGEFKSDLPLSFVQKTIGYVITHAADFTDMSGPQDAEENLTHLINFIKNGLAS